MEEKISANQEADALLETTAANETFEDKAKATECKGENFGSLESAEDCHLLSSNESCQSERILRSKDITNLFRCGSFVPKSGAKAYKSPSLNYTAFYSPQAIFEAMKARSSAQEKSTNLEYLQLRRTYVEWIFELAEKLKISDNSSHLAVLLMDTLYFKDNSHNGKLQLFAPTCLLLAAKTIELDERIPFIPKLRRAANPTFSVDDYKKAEITLLENLDWNPQYTSVLEFLEFFVSQGSVYSSDLIAHEEEDHCDVLKEKTEFHNRISEESTPSTSNGHLEKAWTPKSISDPPQGETATTDSNNPHENDVPENDENKFDGCGQPLNLSMKMQQLNVENLTEGAKTTVNPNIRQSITKTISIVKVSSLKDQEIFRIASSIEKDVSKLCYWAARENEFAQIEPVTVACSCLAFLRKAQKLEPAWNSELSELAKVRQEDVLYCMELLQSKIGMGRLTGQSDGHHNIENTTGRAPLQESNTNEVPCQELKLFSNTNSVSEQALSKCENTDSVKQINLFSASNSNRLTVDQPSSYSKDYSVPSRIEPSKYERARYSTSRASGSQNYSASTSQSYGGHYRQNYHHYTTNYYSSQQHSHYSNPSYIDREYRSRNTMGSYQTESYLYKTSGRTSASSYLRYDSTNVGSTYQPTSSYLSNPNTGTTSTTNPTRDTQYGGSYIRHTDLVVGRSRGSGVLSARLNTSVDSGLNLQSQLRFNATLLEGIKDLI